MGSHSLPNQDSPFPSLLSKDPTSIHLGGGLPPVPGKLAKKIEQGHFIEMAELLPERLSSHCDIDDQNKATKPKHKVITSILEWMQCFGIYVAVISRKEPHRVVDLLGYQHLIIQAYQEYHGDSWLGYDRRFRQRAATNPSSSWSTIDPTLWSLAFSGRGSSRLCSHCFSTSHSSKDCELNSNSVPNEHSATHPFRSQLTTSQGRRPICFDWNETPAPGCPHPSCRFEHSCYYCARNPNARDKAHKAIFCPNRSHNQRLTPFTTGIRHSRVQ